MANPSEKELDERHAEKMKKRRAARDKILATKTEERGLIIVHTGKGKGKSTAAMGLGAEDDSAVVKYYAALAGLELPAPKSPSP